MLYIVLHYLRYLQGLIRIRMNWTKLIDTALKIHLKNKNQKKYLPIPQYD